MSPFTACGSVLFLAVAAGDVSRPDLEGVVLEAGGKPIPNATVLIYTAGVRKGTSPY